MDSLSDAWSSSIDRVIVRVRLADVGFIRGATTSFPGRKPTRPPNVLLGRRRRKGSLQPSPGYLHSPTDGKPNEELEKTNRQLQFPFLSLAEVYTPVRVSTLNQSLAEDARLRRNLANAFLRAASRQTTALHLYRVASNTRDQRHMLADVWPHISPTAFSRVSIVRDNSSRAFPFLIR